MRARRAILGSQAENCGTGQDETDQQGHMLVTGTSPLPVEGDTVLPTLQTFIATSHSQVPPLPHPAWTSGSGGLF